MLTLSYGCLTLELDYDNVDTPAMVFAKTRDHGVVGSTYDCAIEFGRVGCEDEYEIPEDEYRWLDKGAHHLAVNEAFEVARAGHPDYT